MELTLLAMEWTPTTRHWLAEVPLRILAYVLVLLLARWLLHRMIDRATIRKVTADTTTEKASRGEDATEPLEADPADTEHLESADARRQSERRNRPRGKVPTAFRPLRASQRAESAARQRRRAVRAKTIGSVSKSTVSILLLVWGILAILNVLGVNIAPFIASAGVAGLAIGFGAQNLVRDFVTGVFMLLEDQYGVGDFVDLGEASGEVQSVGLRVTTVRDIDGTLWYVRNGEVARVGNMSQEYAIARVEVPVALTADLDEAQEVALQAAEQSIAEGSLASEVLGEPQMLGVQDLSPDLITLRMTIKTRPNSQWAVQRKVRHAVVRAYGEHGIDLPYPNGRIHAGVGSAPD